MARMHAFMTEVHLVYVYGLNDGAERGAVHKAGSNPPHCASGQHFDLQLVRQGSCVTQGQG